MTKIEELKTAYDAVKSGGYREMQMFCGQAYEMMPTLLEVVKDYSRLHDMVSDAIEGGRLTEADIPDDYKAIVGQLVKCNAALENLK